MRVINNEKDGDNKPIAEKTPLMIYYFFLGQLYKWQVMKQKKKIKSMNPFQCLFSLEPHNDPLTVLSLSFFCLLFIC